MFSLWRLSILNRACFHGAVRDLVREPTMPRFSYYVKIVRVSTKGPVRVSTKVPRTRLAD